MHSVVQESPTPAVPLYTEEWVEELLSRCFSIITNLDSPEHRGGFVLLLLHISEPNAPSPAQLWTKRRGRGVFGNRHCTLLAGSFTHRPTCWGNKDLRLLR